MCYKILTSFLLVTLSVKASAFEQPTIDLVKKTDVEILNQSAPMISGPGGCSSACSKTSLLTEQGINLEEMANRYSTLNKPQNQTKIPELLVFVSFSMPEQSLKSWSEQVNKVGGTLVLRGFVENSIQKTTEKTISLFGENEEGGFAVDPERFQIFGIRAVPAVIIINDAQDDCIQEPCVPKFDIVYGDAPLEEALQRIVQQGSEEGKKNAKDLLSRYRDKNNE